nr:phosphate signaling complex protein PhoU [Candidatus Sigynarchaeota archaeon]
SLATCFLEKSVLALVNQDVQLAKTILDKRKEIMEKNRQIEEKCIQLIALYQPMAVDLRTIIAILKIIEDLVRIGRYGKDIAALVEELSQKPHVKKLISIPHMQKTVTGMVLDALNTFQDGDLTRFKDIVTRDNEVDELREAILRECLTYMMEDPTTITRCIHYIMIARYLERCGDHAVKIAERAQFMHTGQYTEFK